MKPQQFHYLEISRCFMVGMTTVLYDTIISEFFKMVNATLAYLKSSKQFQSPEKNNSYISYRSYFQRLFYFLVQVFWFY